MPRSLPTFLKQRFLDKTLQGLSPRAAVCLDKSSALSNALAVLAERQLGSVLVLNEGELCGIATERDFVRRLDPFAVRDLTLGEIMTPDPVTLSPTASIARALHTFAVRGFRHIPVKAETLGVCSARDMIDYLYINIGKPLLAGDRERGPGDDSRGVREFFETPVSALKPAPPKRIDGTDTVEAAVSEMRTYNIGSLVADDGSGQVIGIVTERDLVVQVLAQARVPSEVLVRDIMTPNPETILATSSVARALDFLSAGRFRHLPVVDHSEHLIGMLSVKDILKHLADRILDDLGAR